MLIACLLLGAGTSAHTPPVAPGRAQSTPAALADALVKAIRTKDTRAACELIDPASRRAAERESPDAAARAVTSWMRRQFPDDPAVTIARPEDVAGFDTRTNAISLGSLRIQLTEAPSRMITISHEAKRPNGVRIQAIQEGVVERAGVWRILLSTVVRDPSTPRPSGTPIPITARCESLVPGAGIEPARGQASGDFESPASASSATPAGERRTLGL